ncbi:unnamed protein product (macronuclear) [Paramecium tetraurelia]|uniref:RING-type domain-containing protein n=1 Tax=Paramecium tetraurelia TaxID=5888 RepID=A0C615_PARTE|nr:uncharacterized protein GSPATT00035361001 [Paramecium tetraurelia]CAK66232.1 unnamed protein product [Paramecium tetraurelia]|eukprot:XP_001433629.1 hypothetical protein (macronuclear) [Paramecium tetraurelia strain d4-2]
MLVTSFIPSKIRSQFQKLERMLYWQKLGNKQNFAIFCSIIHYFLNKKKFQPLQKFLNTNGKSLTEDSQQLRQLILQSFEDQNPIQQFFRNLSKQQNYNEKIEKLLDELCRIHFLMKNQKPSLDSIGLFLQIEITLLHSNNEKYGRGVQQILLLKNDNEFYFLIPPCEFKQLPKYPCSKCNIQIQYYIKLTCKHYICLTCIQTQKQNSKDNFFKCECEQIILKNEFLEDAIKETQDSQILNDYHLCTRQFYEMDTKGDQSKKESKYEDAKYLKQQQIYDHPHEIRRYDSKTMDNSNRYKRQNQERIQQNHDNMYGYPFPRQQIFDLDPNDYYAGIMLRQSYYGLNYQPWENRTYQPQTIQGKDHFQEGNSHPFELMSKMEEIRSQQFCEQSQKFPNQLCSYCLSPFDEFNVMQDIGCSKHVIGVCCINRNYEKCPQCEKVKELQNHKTRNMKFKPEKVNIHNQPTIYFGSQIQYKKQTKSTIMVPSSNRLEPTMNSVYGNSIQENQIQMQSYQKFHQPYEYQYR